MHVKAAQPRRLLILSPGSLDTLVEFKVDRMLLQADELGYFEKVVRCHPLTPHRREVPLSATHRIIECRPPGFVRPGAPRWVRLAGLVYHYMCVAVAMTRLIRREGMSLVRATDPYLCGLAGLIAARLSRRPFCVSIHSDYDLCYETAGDKGAPILLGSRWLAKRLERFIVSHADLVLPIREHLAKKVVAGGVPPDRVRVIPHGIDLAPFLSPPDPTVRRRLGVPEDVLLLSFVGRLSAENFVDDLLELARRLALHRSDFILVMAGAGAKLKTFQAMQAEDPVLRRHVRMVGSLPLEDIAALRKASAVSLCLMGGFSLIEACAAGSAVVAYDVDWHEELVRTDETGWLCPKGDIGALAQGVEALLDDPTRAAALGRNARELACSRHSIEASTRKKIVAYEELLAKQSPSTVFRAS